MSAVAVNAVMRAVLVVGGGTLPGYREIVAYVAFATIVCGTPMVFAYRHLKRWNILLFIGAYSLVTVGLNELLSWVPDIPIVSRGGIRRVFIAADNLAICVLGSNLAAWVICRFRLGPVVVQDSRRCPGCAYDVSGCVEQVCPECGREFTLQELGIGRAKPVAEQGTSGT